MPVMVLKVVYKITNFNFLVQSDWFNVYILNTYLYLPQMVPLDVSWVTPGAKWYDT